ncbi:hypothetical protein P609_22575 [Comamonas thiooxydans]|nr:hypothetical protein P609_22575 [Comamonas thiooxydans]
MALTPCQITPTLQETNNSSNSLLQAFISTFKLIFLVAIMDLRGLRYFITVRESAPRPQAREHELKFTETMMERIGLQAI